MIVTPTEARYLKNVLGLCPAKCPGQYENCLRAMAKYDTPWWTEEKDETVLAFYQLKEPMLLIPFRTLENGVSKVLGRRVQKGELSLQNHSLIQEFFEKYREYEQTNNMPHPLSAMA